MDERTMLSKFKNNKDGKVHVVGVYESNPFSGFRRDDYAGTVDVIVTPKAQPVVLVLSSYERVNWNVTITSGASVSKIIIGGFHKQKVVGQGARIPAIVYTYDLSETWGPNVQLGGNYFYIYAPWCAPFEDTELPTSKALSVDQRRQDLNEWGKLFRALESSGETDISSFQGAYNGDRKQFFI